MIGICAICDASGEVHEHEVNGHVLPLCGPCKTNWERSDRAAARPKRSDLPHEIRILQLLIRMNRFHTETRERLERELAQKRDELLRRN